MRLLLTLLLWIGGFSFAVAGEEPVRAVFLNPAPAGNAFWDAVTRHMQAAAEDLGIHLSVHYLDKNEVTSRFAYVNAAAVALAEQPLSAQPLSAQPRPQYLVFLNLKDTGYRILEMAEQAQVKSLIILSDIHPEDATKMDQPRRRFKHWIAHLSPDDENAGYLLGLSLIAEASQRWPSTGAKIAAILGSKNGTAAELRFAGLQRAVHENPSAMLHIGVPTRTWLQSEGQEKTALLLAQYPDLNVVWAASDSLAFGVRDALQQLKPQAITGGVDWTDEGLQAVVDGKITASVGGHFLEGIMAMVMLYDYHHGVDFVTDTGVRLTTPMHVATRASATRVKSSLSAENIRRIDFRKLSKVRTKTLKKYDFSVENILQW